MSLLKKAFLCGLLVLGCQLSTASTDLLTLQDRGSGAIKNYNLFGIQNTYSYETFSSMMVSVSPPCGLACLPSPFPGSSTVIGGFYVFDLSGVDFAVTSATLEVQLRRENAGSSSSMVNVFGFETVAAGDLLNLSSLSSESELSNALSDIQDGTQYGEQLVPGWTPPILPLQTFVIELSGAAPDTINSFGGLFALGMSVANWGEAVEISGATLNLYGDSESVPLPGSTSNATGLNIILLKAALDAKKKTDQNESGN